MFKYILIPAFFLLTAASLSAQGNTWTKASTETVEFTFADGNSGKLTTHYSSPAAKQVYRSWKVEKKIGSTWINLGEVRENSYSDDVVINSVQFKPFLVKDTEWTRKGDQTYLKVFLKAPKTEPTELILKLSFEQNDGSQFMTVMKPESK